MIFLEPTKSMVVLNSFALFVQSPPGHSREDTDCGSAGEEEEEEEEDRGYLSGAESDSGLVDTRQSMNLVMRNLQVHCIKIRPATC